MAKIISNRTLNCFIAFCFILLGTTARAQDGNDIKWLRSIHNNRPTALDGTMKFLCEPYIYLPMNGGVPLTHLLYGYIDHDKKMVRAGWHMAAGLVLSTAITQGLKYSINRERPYIKHPDIIPLHIENDASMPSGHTSFCFATATSLSLQYPKWYVIVPSFAYAAAMGYMRMAMGEHYPSDVFVGALVGAGSSAATYYGQKWLIKYRRKKLSGGGELERNERY